ncbi:MAG: tRNA lysidine(34) synthetase TilS [Williamsia sp.]|nr:tRNA lysidine(34) synthetase TilS [Williamsia sp.]
MPQQTTTLLTQYLDFIKKENLFLKGDRLLLTVSGGVDSVVLCELTQQAGFDFVIAHANFGLRGAESERDETFVRQLGEKYGRPVLVKKFETERIAREKKWSVQVAARTLRYDWFAELVAAGKQEGREAVAEWIVTAHHADDNLETALMNYFKGTGIAGLRGIVPRQQRTVRPLLFARKKELLRFATERGLEWVEDSSNASDKYTRNYFRLQLIPGIQQVFPQAEENMRANLNRFREIEQLYQEAVSRHKSKLLEIRGQEIHIPLLKWKKVVPLHTITYEIIRDYGFTAHQTGEVIELMDAITGSYIQSSDYRIIRNRNWMIISPLPAEQSSVVVIGEEDQQIQFPAGELRIKKIPAGAPLASAAHIAQLDADKIQFPLLLRKLKKGDYFYPLGMPKKKKLGRFLSDLKIALPERENTWVLEGDKKILWVVGRRIDDRFKITPATRSILQITIAASQSAGYE